MVIGYFRPVQIQKQANVVSAPWTFEQTGYRDGINFSGHLPTLRQFISPETIQHSFCYIVCTVAYSWYLLESENNWPFLRMLAVHLALHGSLRWCDRVTARVGRGLPVGLRQMIFGKYSTKNSVNQHLLFKMAWSIQGNSKREITMFIYLFIHSILFDQWQIKHRYIQFSITAVEKRIISKYKCTRICYKIY